MNRSTRSASSNGIRADQEQASPVKAAPRPAKAERDELRRSEIAAAARACVVRHGFHAASMAQIAEQAKMSVGQIYRYFPNKEAIVHDIVERIVSQRLAWIASSARQFDLAAFLASRMFSEDKVEIEDRALLLEVTAEAARNPVVAEIVKKADHRLHAQAMAAVRVDYPDLSEREAAARVEFVAVLSEGTAFRRATEQPADVATLEALYREVIGRLFPPSKPAAPKKRKTS
ncbi:TetR/AcrR family transcriptional regulator [Variovorax sp. HJSM1_2]|uniref:TetR/AcrR family transcriptional regulator n=1 Tax=Variovorax sp. HJSM1_2 TaxID=3366263 RepID=UPI003BCF796A